MPITKTNGCCPVIFSLGILGANCAWAELTPVDDAALSEITGQAYISIDKTFHPDATEAVSYTRINLGMDIKTQMNVDVLELGRYERDGEKAGTSDILINNMALGYIYDPNYYLLHPEAPRPVKEGGGSYQAGEIVPFQIKDPFLEFAFDDTNKNLIGVRIGFGEALGIMSGDVQTFTGNLNVNIVDRGEGMNTRYVEGGLLDPVHFLLTALTPLLAGDSPIQAEAVLVDEFGERDPVRAEMIGVPNGEYFSMYDANGFTRATLNGLIQYLSGTEMIFDPECQAALNCGDGDVHFVVQDCEVLGIAACFDLGQYRSFAVGEIEGEQNNRRLVAPVSGTFMSFQTRAVQWLQDVKNQDPTNEDFVPTTPGAFFNIPKGNVEVNLQEAIEGSNRVRTEFIDRGRGLF